MTITSRRLAHRCRERLTTNSAALPCPASSGQEEAHATVEGVEPLTDVHQEKVDAAK